MTRQRTGRALLEPDAVKVAPPVLRGAQRREALGLPDHLSARVRSLPCVAKTGDVGGGMLCTCNNLGRAAAALVSATGDSGSGLPRSRLGDG